jgi:hypothetical protein
MLFVNFKAYNNYVTDSLYQWDINQKLNILKLKIVGLKFSSSVYINNYRTLSVHRKDCNILKMICVSVTA